MVHTIIDKDADLKYGICTICGRVSLKRKGTKYLCRISQSRWQNAKYRIAKLHTIIVKAKSVPCADCKVQYPYWIMQFDHLGDKDFTISGQKYKGISQTKLLTEIAKCDVVCANCHADRTYKRAQVETQDS